jgi:hypothetical protein
MIVPTWKRQGFESWIKYREHLVEKKGFKSRKEYRSRTTK